MSRPATWPAMIRLKELGYTGMKLALITEEPPSRISQMLAGKQRWSRKFAEGMREELGDELYEEIWLLAKEPGYVASPRAQDEGPVAELFQSLGGSLVRLNEAVRATENGRAQIRGGAWMTDDLVLMLTHVIGREKALRVRDAADDNFLAVMRESPGGSAFVAMMPQERREAAEARAQ